jgi:hypothetical protein
MSDEEKGYGDDSATDIQIPKEPGTMLRSVLKKMTDKKLKYNMKEDLGIIATESNFSENNNTDNEANNLNIQTIHQQKNELVKIEDEETSSIKTEIIIQNSEKSSQLSQTQITHKKNTFDFNTTLNNNIKNNVNNLPNTIKPLKKPYAKSDAGDNDTIENIFSENSIDDRITTTYDINYGYLPQSLRKAAKGISIYF